MREVVGGAGKTTRSLLSFSPFVVVIRKMDLLMILFSFLLLWRRRMRYRRLAYWLLR
jgi:hypothetical protein